MYLVGNTNNLRFEPFDVRDEPSPERYTSDLLDAHPQLRAGSVQRVTSDQAGQARFSRSEKVFFSAVSDTD